MTFVSTAWEYNISLFQYWKFSDIFRSSTRISNYVKNFDPVFHFLGFLIATKKSGLTCCETRPYTENRRESQSLGKKNSKSILALTCVVEIKDGVVTPRLYNIHIHTCRSSNTKAILHYYTTQVDPSPTMVNLRGERKHYCLLITDFHFSTEINFIVSELSFIRMIIYCTIIFFVFKLVLYAKKNSKTFI